MKPHVTKGALLLLMLFILFFTPVLADPSGVTISDNTTETAPTVAPQSQATDRGTITTMLLTSVQQDQHWKAYVGNVSGSLTLDNSENETIYSWELATITGNVFASRYDNLTWSAVSCATAADIAAESVFHNMTASKPDRLNATFNWTIHKQIQIASATISQNTCNSTVTYVSDAPVVPTIAADFQEVLLKDANDQFMYWTDISDDSTGFDNESYDFQMIVAESDIKATPTAYYFYVELR